MSNRLEGKDFIQVGIFTAIYFLVNFVVSMMGFIPIMIPLIAVFVPLIGGIPMMLFLTKIRKPGMLTISALLIGILMLLTGMGYWCILTCLIFGLCAEFILKKAEYKDAKKTILAQGVYSMWTIGAFIPIIITRDSYYDMLNQYYPEGYADALMSYMPDWILPVLLIASLIAGIVGGIIGKNIFKKHFKRAGIL